MKLSDVASFANLTVFTEIALVIFMTVFVAITVRTFMKRNKDVYDRAAMMPLDDDNPQFPRESGASEQEPAGEEDADERA